LFYFLVVPNAHAFASGEGVAMLFLLALGVMLGAAGVLLFQQWRSGVLTAEPERATLPPPVVSRPRGVASASTTLFAAPRLGGRRAV
jgi:hypothetical protein